MAVDKKIFLSPINENNPITTQVLGICSALAVTSQLKPSIVMGLAVIAVVALSNLITSFMREYIPQKVRIIVEMTVVASLVILVDQILKAYAYQMSKQLSVFVGLIITNCIVLGRIEAFSMGNRPVPSLVDGLGNGLGYALILFIVGFFRELFGFGKILGYQVLPESLYAAGYENNGLMVLAPGAFIILALIIWLQRTISGYREE
ncbi:MAG TPA: NADH:ubiquinone reductase (Na(+)-transporting) subunit D [Spirochaetota bacterium]|nr:MAG: Na(+)-translocating NADH-quinone reductase subunit D [Spirochaetes bacterium ADurb.BinA120]HPI21918.1 NADH:ubiquinone reductase (Na(+)-transporting) subunit D [Spirochaetota bacterium]HPO44550.1 NADH:ubiquinone reductase (Na(+)-transporting) subunit D [Spirochaetota bacterium]